ncbi:hypothetical protein BH10CYA1_BH10CYA1_48800 [soil metagenome]
MRIDDDERYEFPQPVRCEPSPPTVPCEPPPYMRTSPPWEQPPPLRQPYPIEQPCPPHGGGGRLRIDVDLNFKDIFRHKSNDNYDYRNQDHRYEHSRYDPRRDGHSDNNRGNGNVIVNNYNRVNVRGGDSNSTSNSHSDTHNQKQDPHKKAEHHK